MYKITVNNSSSTLVHPSEAADFIETIGRGVTFEVECSPAPESTMTDLWRELDRRKRNMVPR